MKPFKLSELIVIVPTWTRECNMWVFPHDSWKKLIIEEIFNIFYLMWHLIESTDLVWLTILQLKVCYFINKILVKSTKTKIYFS